MKTGATLTKQEWTDVHNGLCQIRSVSQQLEGILNQKMIDYLTNGIKLIEKGFVQSYENEHRYYENLLDHFDEVANKIGIKNTVWSVSEVEDLYSYHPFTEADFVEYEGNKCLIKPEDKTWASLWSKADMLVRTSGDFHHCFIEGFILNDTGKEIKLSTGS